ncbi:MAG: PilZ domain-containing protein [Deltaproteobacteria bacterium]|nr:PilZ domain-containing protein [Deltaproteobacteria bacterium]
MPITGLVKVGPPHEPPEALVSARDVSIGGLFIDADRPVRLGARFSASVPLSDGGEVYVAEAAVAYNRVRPHGSGFGVRFVSLDEEAAAKLEAEIDAVTRRAIGPIAFAEDVVDGVAEPVVDAGFEAGIDDVHGVDEGSERDDAGDDADDEADAGALIGSYAAADEPLATGDELSSADTLIGLDLGSDPALGDFDASSWHLSNPLEADFDAGSVQGADASDALDLAARARRRARFWKGMIIVVLGSCSTVAVVAWFAASAPLSKQADDISSRGVSASTHKVLMGEAVVDPLDRPAPANTARSGTDVATQSKPTARASGPGPGSEGQRQGEIAARPRRPLPPLVQLDTAAKTPELDALLASDAKAKAPALASSANPNPSPRSGAKPEATSKSQLNRPEESKTKVATKTKAEREAPGGTALSDAVLASGGAATYELRLSTSAQVMRTYVFRGPERFVIDIVDHEGAVELPLVSAPVTNVRVGRHDGFTRVVFDARRTIRSGRVTKLGDRLTVSLRFED